MKEGNMTTFEDLNKKYESVKLSSYAPQEDQTNQVYDTARAAQELALQNAYEQSRLEADAAKAKIPQTYQQQANTVAGTAEQNRMAFNENAGGASASCAVRPYFVYK